MFAYHVNGPIECCLLAFAMPFVCPRLHICALFEFNIVHYVINILLRGSFGMFYGMIKHVGIEDQSSFKHTLGSFSIRIVASHTAVSNLIPCVISVVLVDCTNVLWSLWQATYLQAISL